MTLRANHDVTLLLGPPGAGKGTQALYLAETLGVPHVASGDLLRENRKRGTDLGKAASEFMDRGDLVPDTLVVDMIIERLKEADAENGVLLDGFPRTLPQAEALENRLAESGAKVRRAIYFDVPTDVLIARLSGRRVCRDCGTSYHMIFNPPQKEGVCDRCGGELYQRTDDASSVVGNRVEVYLRDTKPVIDHYETLGLLRTIDGNRDIEAVKRDLAAAAGQTDAITA